MQKFPNERPTDFAIKSINTIGKDGEKYTYRVEQFAPYLKYPHKHPVHCFQIRDKADSFDWFSFSVIEIVDDVEGIDELKIIDMSHNYQPEYVGKGIPQEMIRSVSRWLNKKVVSSSNLPQGHVEFRSEMATSVWERLVVVNEAYFDDARDKYIYPMKNS